LRPPAGVFLDPAGLHHLVHRAAPRGGGKALLRSAGPNGLFPFPPPFYPVGLPPQFQDPGIPGGWKLFPTFNTMIISFPSLVTAFTIVASLEVAGRLRGGKGLFGWIRTLPWGNPMVASVLLACLLFMVGGFGGAVNAAYMLNSVVH